MARVVSAGVLLALAACAPEATGPVPQQAFEPKAVYSAQSIGPIDGGVGALAFAPNATIPWEGRVLVAPKTGGLIAYGIEGDMGNRVDGKTYTSIAAHAGFELRKLKTSFILAVDRDQFLSAMIIDDARGRIFAAPLADLPAEGVSGVCAMASLPQAPNFGVSRQDGSFEQWQITDTGKDLLQATLIKSGTLSVPASACMSSGDLVFTAGADGGIFEIDMVGTPTIANGKATNAGNWLLVSPPDSMPYLVQSLAGNSALSTYGKTLEQTGSIEAVTSLSMPPVAQPGALALTQWSFGGAGFSAGLFAIADEENNKISLIVRDTLPGFVRHQEAR